MQDNWVTQALRQLAATSSPLWARDDLLRLLEASRLLSPALADHAGLECRLTHPGPTDLLFCFKSPTALQAWLTTLQRKVQDAGHWDKLHVLAEQWAASCGPFVYVDNVWVEIDNQALETDTLPPPNMFVGASLTDPTELLSSCTTLLGGTVAQADEVTVKRLSARRSGDTKFFQLGFMLGRSARSVRMVAGAFFSWDALCGFAASLGAKANELLACSPNFFARGVERCSLQFDVPVPEAPRLGIECSVSGIGALGRTRWRDLITGLGNLCRPECVEPWLAWTTQGSALGARPYFGVVKVVLEGEGSHAKGYLGLSRPN